MKLSSPRLWIGILSSGAVIYVVVAATGRTSPGPLAAVHARVPELQSCSKCHGGLFESMAEACLDCHKDIAEHIQKGDGLHGVLGDEKAMRCAVCHSDHHGADFKIVNRQSFASAGFPDPKKFDHEFVGFPMAGRHLELECSKCHTHADADVVPEGEQRYLGLEQDCATCHEDVHEGRMKLSCAKCHGQTAFDQLHSEGHERVLPLVGAHGEVGCRECHAEGDPRSLEALGGGREIEPRACADCHESPHAEKFVAGVAKLLAKTPQTSCVSCHEPEHLSFREEGLTITPEHHAASGFPLTAPHDEVGCEECHGTSALFTTRYPGRGPDDCASCHQDPHGGQFTETAFGAKGCVACHDRHHFEPHLFGVEHHERTALALSGKHLDVECEACHKVPGEDRPRIFHGTPSKCEGCHEDAHRGFFAPHDDELDATPNGSCAKCHTTTGFRDVPKEGFDHGKWTGFVIRGAHAQETCEQCHPRSPEADTAGRTLGRVSEHFGKYTGCVTCHQDPHAGEFDKPELPKEVEGRTSCARCHSETSFRAFPEGFDHGKWTGFALTGAHGKVGCAECHTPLRKPDPNGRTWERARGTKCADCHEDPHFNQFQKNGVTRCDKCHKSGVSFKDLAFRHNMHSRFRLDRAHSKVACAECHKTVRRGDKTFVRYRPLGRRCDDCHTAQTDPLRRRRR